MKITYKPVKSLMRDYGYSIQASAPLGWITGPQNTFAWYRLKKDAQQRCDALNKEQN